MRMLTRRAFAAATAATIPFLVSSSARAAKAILLRCGNNLPPSHSVNVRLEEAAARIRRETNDAVIVRVFPDNRFGGDSEMLELVRVGGIDIFTPSSLVLSPLVPGAQINTVGFAFSDYGQVWRAMDGDLGRHIHSLVGRIGLHALENVWDNGFRQCTSVSRPLVGPADFSDLKIRVPVSDMAVSLFAALAARPKGLQFLELYAALKSGMFEAQENPLSIALSARLHEVQRYVSLTNHMWDGFFIVFNGKSWSRLPSDVKGVVSRALNDAAILQRADSAETNARARAELEGKGMIFNTTDPEPFRHALRKAGFYAQWKERFGSGAWALLEKHVGRLG